MKTYWNMKQFIKRNIKINKEKKYESRICYFIYRWSTCNFKKAYSIKEKSHKRLGEFEDTNVPWKKESIDIKKVQILNQVKSNCIKKWFLNCINLITLIDFQKLDVSDCVDFSYMFESCKSLQAINKLQTWNVSNGIDFSSMFAACKSLQDLNGLENWNVFNSSKFNRMFADCESLQDIKELKKWNLSNDTNFSAMFAFCKSLKEISLPNTLYILKEEMFFNCNSKLKIHWKNHTYTYEDLLEYEKIC